MTERSRKCLLSLLANELANVNDDLQRASMSSLSMTDPWVLAKRDRRAELEQASRELRYAR